MRPYSNQERAKITAGAIAAVVATGMLFVVALALLIAPSDPRYRRRKAAGRPMPHA